MGLRHTLRSGDGWATWAALQRAEAEFAEMGAAYDLAEARRLLAAHRDQGALGPTSGGREAVPRVGSPVSRQ